jgi:hypothetical protein
VALNTAAGLFWKGWGSKRDIQSIAFLRQAATVQLFSGDANKSASAARTSSRRRVAA